VARAIAEGIQPAAVAEAVIDAVREGRYWVFPNPEFLDMAVDRFHTIADRLDPGTTRQTPGLPPQEQIVAEVMAALTGNQT
jgi:hypothetical protein